MWAWAWLACSTPDPALEQQSRALNEWQQGKAALENRDQQRAISHFETARTHAGGDPLLLAWQAKAEADRGDVETAVALLDQALAIRPDFAEARYNKAAYLCRLQHPELAAAELQLAFEAGVSVTPRQALLDPDFAPWQGHDAFVGVLPFENLAVALEGPEGSVFKGSEFDVRLRVVGAGDSVLEISSEAASGPVQLVAVTEVERLSSEGIFRDLTYRFRVLGEGEVHLGPFRVVAGQRATSAAEMRVLAKAPPGQPSPVGPPWPWSTPRELLLHPGVEAAFRKDGTVFVRLAMAETVKVFPEREPIKYQWKRRNGDEQRVWVYREQGLLSVEIRRKGEVSFEKTL